MLYCIIMPFGFKYVYQNKSGVISKPNVSTYTQNKSGVIGKPMVSTYLAIGFNIFILSLEYFNGVENSIALQTQIYLITNRFGSGSYATFVGSLIVQIKNHNFKALPTLLGERNRTSCSCHAFIQFGLECGKT
jgi:hypothetical protein